MRALVLTLALLAVPACFFDGDSIEHEVLVDAGTGSDASASLETSPRDMNLELVVIAASLVIVIGPVASRRRRRTDSNVDAPPYP